MRHTDLFHLLALQNVPGVGDILSKKLLSHFGSASEIFNAKPSELEEVTGIGTIRRLRLKDKSIFKEAEKELEFILQNNIEVLCFDDPAYPDRLRHCVDGPLLLFARGHFDLNARKVISIVGTRQITAYGMECCRNLIQELAPLDPVIVSGFAYGVDIAAHQAAIENQLQTIGILAHGLNQIYPKSHKKYASKVESNGGFLTEFWSSSNPERENFVKRNRVVAGISEATIVIESAEKGGSLITANLAADYNREVFAVPGRLTDKYSQGCNHLIKIQKANVLTSAADLVYMLNWDLKKTDPPQRKLFFEFGPDEQKIHDFLLANGKEHLDLIALRCGLPVFKVSSLLMNMELKGAIRPLPGKLFEAV